MPPSVTHATDPPVGPDLLGDAIDAVSALLRGEDAWGRWEQLEASIRSAPQSTLAQLARDLELTSFELRMVLGALACEVDSTVGIHVSSLGQVAGDLLVERLSRSQADKLQLKAGMASSRLFKRVLEHGPGGVRVVPVVRGFITGAQELSARVARVAQFMETGAELMHVIMDPAVRNRAARLVLNRTAVAQTLAMLPTTGAILQHRPTGILVGGESGTGKTLFARAIASCIKAPLLVVSSASIVGPDIFVTVRDIFAEAQLRNAVVLFDECETLFDKEAAHAGPALRAMDAFARGVVIMATTDLPRLSAELRRRVVLDLTMPTPDAEQRREIWELHLPQALALAANVDIPVLADRYELTGGAIVNALVVALTARAERSRTSRSKNRDADLLTMGDLEDGCFSQLRSNIASLASIGESKLCLADVVLTPAQSETMQRIVSAIQVRTQAQNHWGLRGRLATGRGICAMFDGPPGTGKTMCAEVIAGEVGLPIFRIEVPDVMSKWLGDTEKNIKAIFREARRARALLLFDEADSLFASRTKDVSSSNDRYANMEVNLLLQELERFDGVAILTTNSWGALDSALIRRILYRVQFELPNQEQRERIWRGLCRPEMTLADDVDFGLIAERYELTGGRIQNAMLKACYASYATGSLTQKALIWACSNETRAAGQLARDPNAAAEAKRARNDAQLQHEANQAFEEAAKAASARAGSGK